MEDRFTFYIAASGRTLGTGLKSAMEVIAPHLSTLCRSAAFPQSPAPFVRCSIEHSEPWGSDSQNGLYRGNCVQVPKGDKRSASRRLKSRSCQV